MNKKTLLFWFTIFFVCIILLLSYFLYGHQLIEIIYKSELFFKFNQFSGGKLTKYNLNDFLFLADKLFLAFIVSILSLIYLIKYCKFKISEIFKKHIIICISILLFLLIPFNEIKILLLSFIFLNIDTDKSFSKPKVFIGLFCIFSLAFLLCPYWELAQSGIAKPILFIALTCTGLLWAYFSSGEIIFTKNNLNKWIFFILALILLIINIKTLNIDIPWKGDEDSHIKAAIMLCFNPLWLFPFGIAIFCFFYTKKQTLSELLPLLFILIILFGIYGSLYEWGINQMIRYPFITRWLHIIPVQLLFFSKTAFFQESLFRIVPFISTVVLSWIIFRKINCENNLIKASIAIAISTIPILFYHSSILYLEMPAVLCMTIVLFEIPKLLENKYHILCNNISWYILIFIGFIKETTIPFLASFVLCRFFIQFKKGMGWEIVKNELKIMFSVMAPLLLYISISVFFKRDRPYTLDLINLIQIKLYLTLFASYLEQFGFLLLLFVLGCFILFKQKQYKLLIFSCINILLDIILHFYVDDYIYIGYARFNIFITPVLIIFSCYFFNYIYQKNNILTWGSIICLFVVNILLSPVNMDGTRKPFWGSPLVDTADHYYPYRDTLLWLKEMHPKDKIRFTGMSYPYFFNFYFYKMNWTPDYDVKLIEKDGKNESGEIIKSLREAKQNNISVVVYHLLGEDIPLISNTYNYKIEKIFQNQAHKIIVYGIIKHNKISTKIFQKAFNGRTGSAIIMDVNTGQIIGLFNRKLAIESDFPPGSILKLLTAYAALKEGITDFDRKIVCTGNYYIGKNIIHCWTAKGHGALDLKKAIAHSCNIHFYTLAKELGAQKLLFYYKKFGFLTKTGINLKNEKAGFIPTPHSLKQTIELAVGEGMIRVTPLQIVNFISCMANKGILYKPFIGNLSPESEFIVPDSDKKYLDYIKLGMRQAVIEGNASRANQKFLKVAGKTGTATISGTKHTHGWFAGFAPFENPKIALVVFVREGKGFTTAADIAKKIFLQLETTSLIF